MGADESESEQIENPTDSDVLCGRGGSINAHPGNERFRELVEKRKRVYLTARFKREKRLIASSIVSEIRALDPPGRFLTKDSKTGNWVDIGDEKARDKTSQALRENAPSIRAEIETEINEQRAEIQRVENEQVVHSAPPDQRHPQYYTGQPWGYFSYYGYAQHSPHASMPPPPPVPPQGAAPPPHHYPHPPPGYTGPWPSGSPPSSAPPPPGHPSQPPPGHYPGNNSHAYPVPDDQKSTFGQAIEDTVEQAADIVSSVTPSVKNWSKASFSFGAPECNSEDEVEENVSVQAKPIVYVHQREQEEVAVRSGRRVVYFQDERNPNSQSHRGREKLPPRAGVMRGSGIQFKPNRYAKKKQPSDRNRQQQQPYHNHNHNYTASGYNHDARERINYSPINQVQNGEECKMSIVDEKVEEDPVMSFVDEDAPLEDEQEITEDQHPQHHQHHHGQQPDDQTHVTTSIFSQMANSVFGSVTGSSGGSRGVSSGSRPSGSSGSRGLSAGSFDLGSMNDAGSITGFGSLAGSVTSFFGGQSHTSGGARKTRRRNSLGSFTSGGASHMSGLSRDETMAVEMEGQEVKLYDKDGSIVDERRIMPPPKPKFEIDWPSKVGSCQSWIPDTLGASSFFSKGSGISPAGSMEMDSCGGSMGGSIGGGSLCKVFEGASPRNSITGASIQNRGIIQQMNSWERNFRCKSPLSMASDDDDQSLISKGSEKVGTLDSSNGTYGEYMNWK